MVSSLKRRVEGNWDNVDDSCMLCEMDERTEWYIETAEFVVADTLSGGPFIVLKEHKDTVDADERKRAEHLAEITFGTKEIEVRMGMVPDHWHAHIKVGSVDLSQE